MAAIEPIEIDPIEVRWQPAEAYAVRADNFRAR
jgi:hypothetical protein